jgi:hypothetical protein
LASLSNQPVLGRQEATAGAFRHGGEVLHFDFSQIRRRNEPIEGGQQVIGINGGVLFKRAVHFGAMSGLDSDTER